MIYMIIWLVALGMNIFFGAHMGETTGEKVYVAFCLQFATTMLIGGLIMINL